MKNLIMNIVSVLFGLVVTSGLIGVILLASEFKGW